MSERDTQAQTVNVEEARQAIAGDGAVAIDVRDADEWAEGHVPGALHLPEGELESRLEDLPKDQRLIVVGEKGDPGTGVAADLRDRGFDAVAIEGGMEAWKDEDFTLQPSPDADLSA